MSDLFSYSEKKNRESQEPLASRMRPRTLDEFWGQDHILAKGRLLRRAIEADRLSSLIFYGPPGTGKTTLARIIANTTRADFIGINAVLCGVKEIRDSIDKARNTMAVRGEKTILFVDEVHRFNKAQQDALLPWVENGTVILIGATTENPYFEVNKALVSRSRIFSLRSLEYEDLKAIAQNALRDETRGFGLLPVSIDRDALDHLIEVSNGDARTLLNALELAILTTDRNEDGLIVVTLAVAEESIQQRAILYDKEGDAHFDTISAFIKSVRGSDPDAALYWLARMVAAGESPNFILRRLLILACEDIGLADPNAITVVNACAQAFDRIGLPEGRYHLAHATLYLATCPKSNSAMAFFDALSVVEKEKNEEVPDHLKDANRDGAGFGHGQGYLYPHAYKDHWVAQQYLPKALQGRVFYEPSEIGYEHGIRESVLRNREAQLAADDEDNAIFFELSRENRHNWVQRSLSGAGQRANKIRNTIFDLLNIEGHERLLDLNAGSALLTAEAVRKLPTGSVTAILLDSADDWEGRFANDTDRPLVLHFPDLQTLFNEAQFDHPFDVCIGRNISAKIDALPDLAKFLYANSAEGARYVFCENDLRATLRLSDQIPQKRIDADLLRAWREADELIVSQFPVIADEKQWRSAFDRSEVSVTSVLSEGKLRVDAAIFARWFGKREQTYLSKIRTTVGESAAERIVQCAHLWLRNRELRWPVRLEFVAIRNRDSDGHFP